MQINHEKVNSHAYLKSLEKLSTSQKSGILNALKTKFAYNKAIFLKTAGFAEKNIQSIISLGAVSRGSWYKNRKMRIFSQNTFDITDIKQYK